MAGRMQPATSKCTISIAVEIRSMPENEVVLPGVDRCLCRGLSRTLLKAHVRFSGGSSAAMRCCYPTRAIGLSNASPDRRPKEVPLGHAGLQEFPLRPHHPVRHRSNAYDQEGADENREWDPSVRRRAVLFDSYVSSPCHFGSAHQDGLIATEPFNLGKLLGIVQGAESVTDEDLAQLAQQRVKAAHSSD